MTPEQRLDRVERILGYFVKEGRRWRVRSREQDEKIDILIQSQMETTEQINKLSAGLSADLAASHALHEKEMAELRKAQKLTHQELHALIKSLRKRRNGNSSD
ncbi:MAG TPA: hypothetical protein VKB05_01060 [Pyrinomonadaceae bacterium]|nr:hypothetical protein [Pyrinomonadaceae bacterium]